MNVNSNLIKYLENKIKLIHKSFSLVLMVIYLGKVNNYIGLCKDDPDESE